MCPELHFVLGGFHFVFSPHALLVLVGVVLGAGVAVRTSRLPVGVVLLAVAVVATAGIAGAR